MVHYGMAKTAQVPVARGVAQTVVGTGVTASSVLAEPAASEGARAFVKEFAKRQGVTAKEFEKQFFFSARPTSLLTRFETTQEIGDIVAFVASAQANVINDAAVRAEGGVLTSIL